MKRRSTVQQNVLAFDNCVERVPYQCVAGFNQTGSTANVMCVLTTDKPANDEWLEQFERHLLRQTTLVDL